MPEIDVSTFENELDNFYKYTTECNHNFLHGGTELTRYTTVHVTDVRVVSKSLSEDIIVLELETLWGDTVTKSFYVSQYVLGDSDLNTIVDMAEIPRSKISQLAEQSVRLNVWVDPYGIDDKDGICFEYVINESLHEYPFVEP